MIAMIIIGSIYAYLMTVGFIQPKATNYLYNGPPNFRLRSDARFVGFAMAVFWPLVLPIAIGSIASSKTEDRESRTKRKRNKEIEEANHKQALARINAETIAIQERELGIK